MQPRFIDDRGVHCAVAQLIADSGEPALARAINAQFEYAFVRDMREPALHAWAEQHGFSVDELALIQPSYSRPATPDTVRQDVRRWLPAITARCAIYGPMSSLLVYVAGDLDSNVTVTTTAPERFARCVVHQLRRHVTSDPEPQDTIERFLLGMDLHFPPLQEILRARLAKFRPGCMQRPGSLAETATITATVDARGVTVDVTTQPHNPESAACIAALVGDDLRRDFTAGPWTLVATRQVSLQPRVRLSNRQLHDLARPAIRACEPTPRDGRELEIIAVGDIADEDVSVTTDATTAFAACVRAKVKASMVERFSVRYGSPPTDYLRIDKAFRARVKMPLRGLR